MALADADRGRRPLADAVHRHDRRVLERRRVERRGGVALVVLGEDVAVLRPRAEAAAQLAAHVQLLAEPDRHRLGERPQADRREREVGLEQPVELQDRLVIEGDEVEVARRDACRAQAVVDGPGREVGVVLLAGEALLLRRGDDLPVPQQGGGGVVVEGGDAEDVGGHGERRARAGWRGRSRGANSMRDPRLSKPREKRSPGRLAHRPRPCADSARNGTPPRRSGTGRRATRGRAARAPFARPLECRVSDRGGRPPRSPHPRALATVDWSSPTSIGASHLRTFQR